MQQNEIIEMIRKMKFRSYKSLRTGLVFILLSSIAFMIVSCNKQKKQEQIKQNNLEQKNEKTSLHKKQFKVNNRETKAKEKSSIKTKKELRYLYHANGGMVGYFDDGTIVGCPKCDFCRTNILAMFNDESMGTYEVQSDGSLLINNSNKEFPNYSDDSGWALIDYKWNEKVPQY